MTIIDILLVATIALCIVLCLSLRRYRVIKDGEIVVNKADPTKDTYTLVLYIPFGELDKRDSVIFKVRHE